MKKDREKSYGEKVANVKFDTKSCNPDTVRAIDIFCAVQKISRAALIIRLFEDFIATNKEYFDLIKKL